jgi:hypothetical protein
MNILPVYIPQHENIVPSNPEKFDKNINSKFNDATRFTSQGW